MKENKEKEKERARCIYAPPKIDVHAIEFHQLLRNSVWGNHIQGMSDDDDAEHIRGLDDGKEVGAKTMILGQEFSFSDLWEE